MLGAALIFIIASPIQLNQSEEAQRIKAICPGDGNNPDNLKCLGKEFVDLIQRRGFNFTSETLLALQNFDSSSRNCHVIAHAISQNLMRRNPGKGLEALSQIDPGLCGGGFMHGILEVMIGENPELEVDASLFDKICARVFSGGYSTSCAHILGHIILVEKSGILRDGLAACSGLTGEFLFECYGGVFMEDSFRTNFFAHGLGDEPVRDEDWFRRQKKRCEFYGRDEVMEMGCYYDLAEVAAQIYDFNVQKTYSMCKEARSKKAEYRCYARASYIIATAPIPKIDSMDFSELCSLYDPGAEVNRKCVDDTVGALLSYSLAFIPRAVAFCEASQSQLKENCFRQIGVYLGGRSLNEKEGYCFSISPVYKGYCLGSR